MSAVAAIAGVPSAAGGAGAFARALRDPRVQGVAKSLNVDLGDPGTLRSLFARAREAFKPSAPVGAVAPVAGVDPDTIPNHYVRNAIRAYQDVIRMA